MTREVVTWCIFFMFSLLIKSSRSLGTLTNRSTFWPISQTTQTASGGEERHPRWESGSGGCLRLIFDYRKVKWMKLCYHRHHVAAVYVHPVEPFTLWPVDWLHVCSMMGNWCTRLTLSSTHINRDTWLTYWSEPEPSLVTGGKKMHILGGGVAISSSAGFCFFSSVAPSVPPLPGWHSRTITHLFCSIIPEELPLRHNSTKI